MKINNYGEYILESVEAREAKMFYSTDFMDMLYSMISPISVDLIDLLKNDKLYSYSYIDISNESDKISILPINRLARIAGATEKDLISPLPDSPVWGKYGRTLLRIGAFVTAMLPKYERTKDLASFIQEFIGKLESDKYEMILVEGEDIRKWYHVDNYYNESGYVDRPEEGDDDRSILLKSCMKQPEKQSFFDIYVKNPTQCKMLIMLNKEKELVARAIVWIDVKVAVQDRRFIKTFLDRIYYTSESDVSIFKDYAVKNGWAYKTEQTKDCDTIVVDGVSLENQMKIRLINKGYYHKYPYLDTLCYYTPDTGRLSNNKGVAIVNTLSVRYGETEPGEPFIRYQLRKIGGGYLKLLPK